VIGLAGRTSRPAPLPRLAGQVAVAMVGLERRGAHPAGIDLPPVWSACQGRPGAADGLSLLATVIWLVGIPMGRQLDRRPSMAWPPVWVASPHRLLS